MENFEAAKSLTDILKDLLIWKDISNEIQGIVNLFMNVGELVTYSGCREIRL